MPWHFMTLDEERFDPCLNQNISERYTIDNFRRTGVIANSPEYFFCNGWSIYHAWLMEDIN
jgi:hypothetical protein